MHECPECGQACYCDGEDTWNDIGSSDWMNCTHECEDLDLDNDDFLPSPEDDEIQNCSNCSRWFLPYEGNFSYDDGKEIFICDECAAQHRVQRTNAQQEAFIDGLIALFQIVLRNAPSVAFAANTYRWAASISRGYVWTTEKR
jgi:hypothetical protein